MTKGLKHLSFNDMYVFFIKLEFTNHHQFVFVVEIDEINVTQIKKHYWINYNSDIQDYPKKTL